MPVPYIERPFCNLLVKRRQLKVTRRRRRFFVVGLVLVWPRCCYLFFFFPPKSPAKCLHRAPHQNTTAEWMNPQFTYRFVALRRSFRTRRYALSPTTVSPKRLAIRFLASTYCGRISWPNWPVYLYFVSPSKLPPQIKTKKYTRQTISNNKKKASLL